MPLKDHITGKKSRADGEDVLDEPSYAPVNLVETNAQRCWVSVSHARVIALVLPSGRKRKLLFRNGLREIGFALYCACSRVETGEFYLGIFRRRGEEMEVARGR